MSEFSMEHQFLIYNDETSDRIEVGNDGDGLNLVEVRVIENRLQVARMTMPPQQALLVAKAIRQHALDLGAIEKLEDN